MFILMATRLDNRLLGRKVKFGAPHTAGIRYETRKFVTKDFFFWVNRRYTSENKYLSILVPLHNVNWCYGICQYIATLFTCQFDKDITNV